MRCVILTLLFLFCATCTYAGFSFYLGIPDAQVQGHYLRLKEGSNYFPIAQVQYHKVYDSDQGNIYHCFFPDSALYFFDVMAYFVQNTDYTVDEIQGYNATQVNEFVSTEIMPNGKTLLGTSQDRCHRDAPSLVGQDREWLTKAYLLNFLAYDSDVYFGPDREDIFTRYPGLDGNKTVGNSTVPIVQRHEFR